MVCFYQDVERTGAVPVNPKMFPVPLSSESSPLPVSLSVHEASQASGSCAGGVFGGFSRPCCPFGGGPLIYFITQPVPLHKNMVENCGGRDTRTPWARSQGVSAALPFVTFFSFLLCVFIATQCSSLSFTYLSAREIIRKLFLKMFS